MKQENLPRTIVNGNTYLGATLITIQVAYSNGVFVVVLTDVRTMNFEGPVVLSHFTCGQWWGVATRYAMAPLTRHAAGTSLLCVRTELKSTVTMMVVVSTLL